MSTSQNIHTIAPRLSFALRSATFEIEHARWEAREPEIGIGEIARRAASRFTTTTRGDETITILRDDAPAWVTDLVYHAHGGDFLPDDWRYSAIRSALDRIAETDATDADMLRDDGTDHEWADGYVDVYTSDRYAWLSSNLQRSGYVDEAVSTFGLEDADTVDRIGSGQYMEASEIFGLVLDALDARREEIMDEWYADEPGAPARV